LLFSDVDKIQAPIQTNSNHRKRQAHVLAHAQFLMRDFVAMHGTPLTARRLIKYTVPRAIRTLVCSSGSAMPIYAYKCASCGYAKDVLQKISDAPLTVCPQCGAAAFVKQVTAAGFQLKGTGWYATDFRGGSGAAASADKDGKAEPKPDAAKGEAKPDQAKDGAAKSEAKTEAQPESQSQAKSAAPSGGAAPAPSPPGGSVAGG
jgi:putative FmdB family regulatory protein